MPSRSNAFRLAALVALLAAAIVLFLVLKGNGGGNAEKSGGVSPEPAAKTIVVKNGKPAGGVQKLTYTVGQRVRFTVHSDVADEIHVHGYDYMKDVAAGGFVNFDFPARLEGDFEAELEHRKQQIIDLRVLPR